MTNPQESKAELRCAVYTRKSTDEGLDQDFNTLDAQREAAEAFIASQKAEGWVCLPDNYDDGGFTGGNLERPALRRLSNALQSDAGGPADELLDAFRRARDHDQSAREIRRIQRLEMAMRLVRWLSDRRAESQGMPPSLAAAAGDHLHEGGFVDWARLSLRAGDPVRELSEAYARLFERVTQIRQRQAHDFAKLLADWTGAGSLGDDVIPVERVLEQVVAPLAAERLVLVIVVDGMSEVERAIAALRGRDVTGMRPTIDEAAVRGLKFSECLPLDLATEMLERRLQDPAAVRQILAAPVRCCVQR